MAHFIFSLLIVSCRLPNRSFCSLLSVLLTSSFKSTITCPLLWCRRREQDQSLVVVLTLAPRRDVLVTPCFGGIAAGTCTTPAGAGRLPQHTQESDWTKFKNKCRQRFEYCFVAFDSSRRPATSHRRLPWASVACRDRSASPVWSNGCLYPKLILWPAVSGPHTPLLQSQYGSVSAVLLKGCVLADYTARASSAFNFRHRLLHKR